MQSQLVTLSSAQSTGQGMIAGGKSNEPFVTHKLLIGKDKITGDEEFTVIDEWINDLMTDLEIIMPGSKRLLKEAENSSIPSVESIMMGNYQSAMCTKLSQELFVILTKKTVSHSKATFELMNLTENQGLEALRQIRLNLCKREGPRLQDEYEAGTTLPKHQGDGHE